MKSDIYFSYELKAPINKIEHEYSSIGEYLYMKTKLFISYQNADITTDSFEIFTYNSKPNYIFVVVYTKTNVNHPYLTFADITTPTLTIILPIGKDYGQVDFNEIYDLIDSDVLTDTEYMALYILTQKTINIRQKGVMVFDRYNILKCNAITHCKEKVNDLKQQYINYNNTTKIDELIKYYTDYYYKKGINLLTKYFTLLQEGEFRDAFEFLKGGQTKKSKYYGCERLNTFFINTKDVIGHLQIFIPLYEILSELDKYF